MIQQNLQIVRDKIAVACASVHRNPAGIKLIAVSKYFGLNEINEARKAGLTDFGENKAQELKLKHEKLDDVTWHFIGNLQKNKVKYVVKAAEFIHSVDSIELAEEINKHAEKLDKVQKILIEVKTSEEETKAGVEDFSSVKEIAAFCSEQKYLELIGLMTMAPFVDDENIIRQSFTELRKLKDELNQNGFNLSELSMGMTSDYKIAIEEGATMLRIGSAIFGERDYNKDWRQI